MTHNEIIALLKSVFEANAPTGTFLSGTRPDALLNAITAAEPFCVVAPIRFTKDYKLKNKDAQITIFFLYKDSLNNGKDARNTIITNSESLLDSFMLDLIASPVDFTSSYFGKFDMKGQALSTPEVQILQKSFSGFSTQFTITSKINTCT